LTKPTTVTLAKYALVENAVASRGLIIGRLTRHCVCQPQ
jgi:hypothetical protein